MDLTPETKQKIVSGNIARLYGIDMEAKGKVLADDEFAGRRTEHLASREGATTASGATSTSGVAGAVPE